MYIFCWPRKHEQKWKQIFSIQMLEIYQIITNTAFSNQTFEHTNLRKNQITVAFFKNALNMVEVILNESSQPGENNFKQKGQD